MKADGKEESRRMKFEGRGKKEEMGFCEVSLGDVALPRREKVSPFNFPEMPYIGLEHVESHSMRILGYAHASEMKSTANRFYKGDVLYSRLRPYLNKVVEADRDGICSSEFIVFPPSKFLTSSFLKHRLNSSDFVAFASSLNAGDRPRVDFNQISSFKFLLPSSLAQSKIVAKLEELFTDLDAGVTELKAAQKKLAQYRQSLLKAAVTGELTAEWRERQKEEFRSKKISSFLIPTSSLLDRILKERRSHWEEKQLARFKEQGKTPPKGWQDKYPEPVRPDTANLPGLPEGWVWTRVELAGKVQLGRQRAPQYHTGPNMVPYLRVANVFEDRIDISDVMEMHFSPEDEENFRLTNNDILLNEGQSLELIGRPAIYRNELPRACFTNTLVRFQAEEGVLPEFSQAVFLHYLHSGRFRKIAKITTNIAHLGAGRFAGLEFPLPSQQEQCEIVRCLAEQMNNLVHQQAAIDYALKQAAAQRKNILKSAFSGQLVPQDPDDEPASALLERIRAERELAAKENQNMKRTRRKQAC